MWGWTGEELISIPDGPGAMGDLFGAPPLARYVPSRSLIWRTRSSVTALLLSSSPAPSWLSSSLQAHAWQLAAWRRIKSELSPARVRRIGAMVTVKAERSGQRRQAVRERSVKSCAGVVRLASTWKAGLVSVAEAKQLSFFRGMTTRFLRRVTRTGCWQFWESGGLSVVAAILISHTSTTAKAPIALLPVRALWACAVQAQSSRGAIRSPSEAIATVLNNRAGHSAGTDRWSLSPVSPLHWGLRALRISAGCDRGQQVPVGLAGVEQ